MWQPIVGDEMKNFVTSTWYQFSENTLQTKHARMFYSTTFSIKSTK